MGLRKRDLFHDRNQRVNSASRDLIRQNGLFGTRERRDKQRHLLAACRMAGRVDDFDGLNQFP